MDHILLQRQRNKIHH